MASDCNLSSGNSIDRDEKLLSNFAQDVAPNVSPLEGNSIENDERVSYSLVSATNVPSQVETVDWSNSIIERCRFESTTISNSSFEKVGIFDCDLSGVVFNNCLLRDCLITGVKARSYLAFDNCILDGLIIAHSRSDILEFNQCQISNIEFFAVESQHFSFLQCHAYRRKGRVSLQACEISKVSGLESMAKSGVSLHVDIPMWRDLGDYYLKERGIKQLDCTVVQDYGLLDEIGDRMARNRKLR